MNTDITKQMEIPTQHGAIPGKTQLSPTNYYNLDMIISLGYRIKSSIATQFRRWATPVAYAEYLAKKI